MKGNKVTAMSGGIAASNGHTSAIAAGPLFEANRFRMLLVSLLAGGIGGLSGIIAYLLYNLIGLFTNLFYFHRWSFVFVSPMDTPLGAWIILNDNTSVLAGRLVGRQYAG